jgi:very-short-patch-repair endonuclease
MSAWNMQPAWRAHTDLRSRKIETPSDGLLTRAQLEKAGFGKAARGRRVKSGLLVPVLPGVFRIAAVPESWVQWVRATWLWLRRRGVLSHLTSASLMRLIDHQPFPIEVWSTIRSLKSPSDRITVHRVGELDNCDLRWLEDMRITNALRTVFDLAGSLNPERLEFVLDEARRRRLVAERPLRDLLDRLGRCGRPGTRQLRALLDSGEMSSPTPGSPFERKFLQFLRRRAFPPADRQVPIYDDSGNFVARVDFAYPELKIAIECDSKRHHFGRRDWEHDIERRTRLAALGWLVIHVSWDMLVNRPDELEALIRGALGQQSLLDQ